METGGLLMLVDFTQSRGVNFARYKVKDGEYLFVAEGFALRVHGAWFRNDGYMRVEGVIAVGV
jgi:hypothetical protein